MLRFASKWGEEAEHFCLLLSTFCLRVMFVTCRRDRGPGEL
jgi:hypothetical protein